VLDLTGFTPVVPAVPVLAGRPATLWRYAEALPVAVPADITMGEGMTPLVAAPDLPGVLLKVDYLMPTGSFKDRGAVVLTALARQLAVPRMIADSSGNAGTAVAAYAARARIPCEVYVPAATSPGKVAQLRAYGATVRQVPGSREDTAAAAMRAAGEPGTFYASHVYHPFFLHGTKTYALELWEQLGGRLPAVLVLPVGNGTLVLGAYLACRELLAQGLISRLPSIAAVQVGGCAPLASAFRRGLATPDTVVASETIAEGIAIARPARGEQILAAVRDTGGTVVTVSDDQIRAAHAALARSGLYVEPTAAVCWAALRAGLIETGPVTGGLPRAVAPLCGSGLKSRPPADLAGSRSQGAGKPFGDVRDGTAELGAAIDMERDRYRGQPFPGIHCRVAGGAGQDAPLTAVDGFQTAHWRPDIRGDRVAGSVEHDPGLEPPAGRQVPLQQFHVVQVVGCAELVVARDDRSDPVNAVGADRAGAMRVAEQVPASVPHDDRPRVNVFLPLAARLAAVADAHPALGRDGGYESARGRDAGAHGPAVGRGGRDPAHGRGLLADVLRQRPDELAQGGADRVVGVRGRVAAVKHGHDQAERLGGAEHQRRQPDAPPDPVTAIGSAGRLHRDFGFTQDLDVAARGPFGHAKLGGELAAGDAGLGLQ